ncbi:hypothetical protein [Kiloniella sp. b19]|uniref:hypothetical protein n=1 Tax=Kiloniella sp. GXU_MW_B19 TaxID=3141326 RepID=UPI0031E31F2D
MRTTGLTRTGRADELLQDALRKADKAGPERPFGRAIVMTVGDASRQGWRGGCRRHTPAGLAWRLPEAERKGVTRMTEQLVRARRQWVTEMELRYDTLPRWWWNHAERDLHFEAWYRARKRVRQ